MYRTLLLTLVLGCAALAQNPTAAVVVDANANRHLIDPRVYGVAYGTTAQLSRSERPLESLRGQQQQPLQLAVERRQSRSGLVTK